MKIKKVLGKTAIIFLGLITHLVALTPAELPADKYGSSGYFWVLLKTSFSLLIVIGLIFIAARIFLAKASLGSVKKKFFVFDKLTLEPQVSLYLVKIGPKFFLIGVGGKRLVLVETFSEEQFPEAELSSPQGKNDFAEFLKKIIQKKSRKEES